MKKIKRCWICKRTIDEVYKDWKEQDKECTKKLFKSFFKEIKFVEIDQDGLLELCVCPVCMEIMKFISIKQFDEEIENLFKRIYEEIKA